MSDPDVGDFVDLSGIRTWYDRRGAGDPLVMLHPGGAGVDSRAFGPNIAALSARFEAFTPERRGHGRTPDVPGPLSFDDMAADTVAFIEAVVKRPVRLLGCSDGSIVALLSALLRPDLVSQLVLIAGPFHHSGWIPEAIDPANEPPQFLRESYDELSPDGIDHYQVIVRKLAQLHQVEPTLSAEELALIECRALVMVGDDDEVRLEHAIEAYRALPMGELAVIPGTSHGLLVEKPELCDHIILQFLTEEPIQTYAPVRRQIDRA
jgi:pimeloyl-ACP methyl ester carboxylesterase